MRTAAAVSLALALAAGAARAQRPGDLYRLGPDSQPHEGVPKGEVVGPLTLESRVFPGTTRHYWVYVPAQYDPAQPAALMVFQDGHAFVGLEGSHRIPHVFDNLIHRREMPITIGVFINPGHTANQPEATDADWGDRNTNRRVEYNALDDKYPTLIVDELLPTLKAEYNISDDPERRAIAGASSGAICAFNVAWHRPDQFRKVISTIGSFTNILGGHAYPDIVREADPKPIRVFLQDGRNDNRGRRRGGGYDPEWDWFAQNLRMAGALEEKGYDVAYVWGVGAHDGKHGGAIMPEMLRWLWRDHDAKDPAMEPEGRRPLGPASGSKGDEPTEQP